MRTQVENACTRNTISLESNNRQTPGLVFRLIVDFALPLSQEEQQEPHQNLH